VFDAGAESVVIDHAGAMSFPACTVGREAIADVVVLS
jgi:hypothetical protein